jgi:glycyl-tRNA synthetase alpha chain
VKIFETYEEECAKLLEEKVVLPAYDCVMKCSHAFNLLDARGAIGVAQRTNYMTRLRKLARKCALIHLENSGQPDGN